VTSEKRFEFKPNGDFWSQAPVVLFAAAAVLAILFVNVRSQAAGIGTPVIPAAPQRVSPQAGCADCGVIVAVDANEEAAAGLPAGRKAGLVAAVRMADGGLRTVRLADSGFAVGDRVHLKGDTLIAGSD